MTLSLSVGSCRQWAKQGKSPLARSVWRMAKGLRQCSLPCIPGLHHGLYRGHVTLLAIVRSMVRAVYWTPMFRSQVRGPAGGLYLYGGMPQILGPLDIHLGNDCRISGQTTLCGRTHAQQRPELLIGDNVDVGWQTTLAVGNRIRLGNNVRLAGRCFLAGFPGHPMHARQRAMGLPEHDDQVGDILLEDDVWLATGVMVMAGVRIGAGTVVAAGSVVTHDLPAGVLAAGVPARVIKSLV